MKKKLYFHPKKPTHLNEYITIEYGKIRNVHFMQLGSEYTAQEISNLKIVEKIEKTKFNFDDHYRVIKNFHIPLKLKKVDPYIKKQRNAKYTHQIILPSDKELQMFQMSNNPPGDIMFKLMLRNRTPFIKLNLFERLYLMYYSSSWGNLNTDQKITIIGIIIGSTISITLAIIGWFVFGN